MSWSLTPRELEDAANLAKLRFGRDAAEHCQLDKGFLVNYHEKVANDPSMEVILEHAIFLNNLKVGSSFMFHY